MCVKKYNRSDCLLDDEGAISIKEHKTTTFNTIIEKRKDRVLIKELRSSDKKATTEDKLDKDSVDAGKKVRFNFKQIEYKTLTDGDQNKAHINKSFLNSDDEDETFNESLPELKSSYDCTEMENTNDVDLSHSTGTFFSNTSISESPRLKSSQFFNDQDKTKENNKKYTTDISLFRDDDSDLSDDDQSCNLSPENDRESNHQNKKLIMEMKNITNTLPKLTSAEQSKSKHVEEEAREKQSNDIGKKKFVKQSNKDKSKMKNALKDLMKTTKETKASLPSSTDKKFIETERNLKTDKKTIASELNATDPTENVLNNDNKARATETPLSSETELSSPQTVDKRKTKKDFQLEESSSDGDDVQMIYQSDKMKTHSDMKEIRQIPSKPILKIQKGDSPKLSSSRLVDKDKVKPSNLFQSNKKFKMPEDFDLGDDGDIWSSLRSSNVIPVCLTDRTKSVDLTDTSQGPVERDLEILDWDNDNDEKAGLDRIQKQLKYQTSSPNTTQSKENSTSKRTKRGVNRFDSSRKYLGASVPQKTKKTVK